MFSSFPLESQYQGTNHVAFKESIAFCWKSVWAVFDLSLCFALELLSEFRYSFNSTPLLTKAHLSFICLWISLFCTNLPLLASSSISLFSFVAQSFISRPASLHLLLVTYKAAVMVRVAVMIEGGWFLWVGKDVRATGRLGRGRRAYSSGHTFSLLRMIGWAGEVSAARALQCGLQSQLPKCCCCYITYFIV